MSSLWILLLSFIFLLCLIHTTLGVGASQPQHIFWNYDPMNTLTDWTEDIVTETGTDIQVGGGGTMYRTNSIDTSGYHHIHLEFDLYCTSSNRMDPGEYAKIQYQINDAISNWITVAQYLCSDIDLITNGSDVELPTNCSDVTGLRIRFENTGTHSSDIFYIQNRLRLTGTTIITDQPTTHQPTTNQPTTSKTPTTNPTIYPTTYPTINPTVNPTTTNPTANPTVDPTVNPTKTVTDYPTTLPTVAPTISIDYEHNQNYTVSIKNANITDTDLDDIVFFLEAGQTNDIHVNIVVIKRVDGETIILLTTSSAADTKLENDYIEQQIEDKLKHKYPDIEVDVQNANDGKNNKKNFPFIIFFMSIIAFILIIIVIILVTLITSLKKKQNKVIDAEHNIVRTENDMIVMKRELTEIQLQSNSSKDTDEEIEELFQNPGPCLEVGTKGICNEHNENISVNDPNIEDMYEPQTVSDEQNVTASPEGQI